MSECPCLERIPDETYDRINKTADTLSIDIILVILEENLCPYAAEIMAGKLIAALSARIYLLRAGPEEAKKLESVGIMNVPATRKTLETVIHHAKTETEERSGACN